MDANRLDTWKYWGYDIYIYTHHSRNPCLQIYLCWDYYSICSGTNNRIHKTIFAPMLASVTIVCPYLLVKTNHTKIKNMFQDQKHAGFQPGIDSEAVTCWVVGGWRFSSIPNGPKSQPYIDCASRALLWRHKIRCNRLERKGNKNHVTNGFMYVYMIRSMKNPSANSNTFTLNSM